MATHQDDEAQSAGWPDLKGTCVYDSTGGIADDECCGLNDDDAKAVREIISAVEQAPGAKGVLQARRIHSIKDSARLEQWKRQIENLRKRFTHADFPKPSWRKLAVAAAADDESKSAIVYDRDQVADHLRSISSSEAEGVQSARVFQGVKSVKVANLISDLGIAKGLQTTKGWYCEGPYTTTKCDYALRYCWMREFWNEPGRIGYVIVARACFSNVYPVTQADNPEGPTTPGLKGKPVGGWSAPGAQGCDANFVCVRSYPPHGDEERTTYHPCLPDERPRGTELVVSEECQLLPEYIVEIAVTTDEELLSIPRLAARADERRTKQPLRKGPGQSEPGPACSNPADAPTDKQLGDSGTSKGHHSGNGSCPMPQASSSDQPMPPSPLRSSFSGSESKAAALKAMVLAKLREAPEDGMDTLCLAKACKLETQKDITPTLYMMEKNGLLRKLGNPTGKSTRPHWIAA